MAYVNSPRPSPPPGSDQPESVWSAYAKLFRTLPFARLRAWFILFIIVTLAALVTLLALAPPYAGLATGLELQPARLVTPIYTYLFRNALFNTGWLLLGVYALALPLGWAWAVTGVEWAARPFLLLPLFIPGALIGLLWRPLFGGWLDLAQAELALLVTGLVILWRAVPLAAWFFSWDRDAWPKLIPLCALLILLDGDLVLTLTRGEPFNASHIWSSWLLQQLWVSRAWGYVASMAGALAMTLALLTWWAVRRSPSPLVVPHGSPLGLTALFLWIVGPFVMSLWAFLQAPLQAFRTLVDLGALLWLVNGALLWGGATWLAMRFDWSLPSARARLLARIVTLAMLPITIVALAYLAHHLPILRNLWLLMLLTSLLTAGLLMGDDTLIPRRKQWVKAAGYVALVLAYTFPLQLVMQLPAPAWTPALGIVWTLAEAPHATAALGAALLIYAAWAGVGAWMVAR